MKKLSTRIAENLVRQKIIEEEMLNIYIYGIQIMLETMISMAASLVICLLLGMIIEGIIFFIIFIPLRSFLGGFHLKEFWTCFILSVASLICVLLAVRFIPAGQAISWVMLILAVFVMCYVMHRTKDLHEDNRHFYARALIGVLAAVVLGILFTIFVAYKWLFLVACVCCLVAVSKLIEMRPGKAQ
jgi:accessory gene regulator protein AgrB